jgi:hypothetical protein
MFCMPPVLSRGAHEERVNASKARSFIARRAGRCNRPEDRNPNFLRGVMKTFAFLAPLFET